MKVLFAAALAFTLSIPVAANANVELRPAPLYGGDIRSLVFDPGTSNRVFAGSSAGHVYRSDDGGAEWKNAGVEIPFPGWVVGTLAFDPDRPSRLWAGQWGIFGGGRVAFSDDLGATWQERPLGEFAGDQVYALALVPGSPGRLWLGTRAGVLVSDDGARTFRAVGRDVPGLVHVSSLYVESGARRGGERVIAGTWRRAWRSDDGGASWGAIHEGMVLDTEVFSLHPVIGRPGELWASSCGWVYRAERWGDRWSRFKGGLTERRTPSFRVLAPERLLAGTVGGSFLSTDGGTNFRRTSRADLSVLAIAHHPTHPERVLLGTEGSGVWLSTDGGESFSPRPVGLRNVRVPALARLGDQVFAALVHAGPSSGVFRSPDGGVSFEPAPAEVPAVLDLAAFDGRVLAATERGLFERAEATAWRRVDEAGERRVEQLAVAGERLAVRTADALFEGTAGSRTGIGAQLKAVNFTFKPPRAVGWGGDELWVAREDGLFRLTAKGPVKSSSPFAGGQVVSSSGDLLYAGSDGVFRRDPQSGEWTALRKGISRALATGDRRFGWVVVGEGGLELYDSDHASLRPFPTPFPAGETLSALVSGGRLLVGTSGYGLWEGALPD
jgi:hypothetical protein